MKKLFTFIRPYWRYVVAILVLLVIQANLDLGLPEYTSNIVNVGISRSGIADAAADTLREETVDQLSLLMSEEDASFVRECYTLQDGIYTRNKQKEAEREKLSSVLSGPMFMLYMLTSDEPEMKAMFGAEGSMPHGADAVKLLEQMPEEQRRTMAAAAADQLAQLPETVVEGAAISFVKQEYEAQGISLERLQNSFMAQAAGKMLLFALGIALCSITVTYLSCRMAAGVSRTLREAVFSKVVSFSSAELNQFSTASLITRSTNDIQQVQMLLTVIFRIALYAPILGVGGVVRAMNTSKNMAWVIALAVGAIMLVVAVLYKTAMPKFKILQTLIDRVNLVSREILQGISVIRAFSTQKREEERFDEANKNLMKVNLFVNRVMTFMMPLMMFIMNGTTVLIVWRGAHNIEDGALQVGDMMAYIQYTMMIIMSFLMLTMLSIMLPRASVSAVRVSEILDTKAVLKDPETPEKGKEEKKGLVEFKNVSFAYPGASESVLSGITFTARPGETTAIIGSTGCGKSTLVRLIPRFYDVTEGEILVDGVDIRKLPQKELRDRLGYVPQKGVLFSGTISSNLRYGKTEAADGEVAHAAQIAQAYDFIMEKEGEFNAPIAQGGTNVSGGQKQRLSIARAIVKQPEIYIFDDSFSALDYRTDVELRRALRAETKDATVILVAQRISTILHAEQIIVLDEGRIAGIGTHKELLNSCETYYQIAASQLSKEELENE